MTHSIPIIYKTTGCKILIEERESNGKHQVGLTLHEQAEPCSGTKKAIELVENTLVGLVGQEESRGRLLYDMALSYGDVRPDGVVFQRNPLNSMERVWMCLIDLPCYMHEGEMKYLASPFADGETFEQMHKANCALKLCKESFGVKLVRCPPYAFIFGKQVNNVSSALVVGRNALKRFKQNNMALISQASVNKPLPPSRWDGLLDSNSVSKKVAPKQRIVAIPEWLILDVAFQQQIESMYRVCSNTVLPF